MNRSGKSRCEICKEPNILQDHHILGRDVPNYNMPNNRVNICPNCHNKVHHGEIVIEGWKMTSCGRELFWHNKNEQSLSGQDAITHIIKCHS